METTTQNSVAGVLARLEGPFASKDVKWLVAATSRDNRKGRVTPYADPRAYTDRLNEVVTPSGWTRVYTVHTVSPVTRMKKDKPVQSGKVLVTCVVTIPGVGAHCGSGEEWADDENAMTSAEAQAFKRACSCFGLGRYFYNFGEMWVELNDYRQPRQLPNLPAWALPANERGKSGNGTTVTHQEGASDSASRREVHIPKGPLDATVTGEIAGCKRDLGATLFMDVLERVAHVRSPRDIPNQNLQQTVLSSMKTCVRGMQRIREIAAGLAEAEFYAILDKLNIQSLDRIPSFKVFQELGRAMTAAAEEAAA
jgi:hypothetical protein